MHLDVFSFLHSSTSICIKEWLYQDKKADEPRGEQDQRVEDGIQGLVQLKNNVIGKEEADVTEKLGQKTADTAT